jgi:putative ABC transport system ATP-binding protein
MTGLAIDLRRVTKDYETAAGAFRALEDVDLRVWSGEFLAIVGRSGSGKSTLLNMIAGIDRPTSGEVAVGETRVDRLRERDMAGWRGRELGIVFQFFQLLPTLTAVENVLLAMDFVGRVPVAERLDRSLALLAEVDMTSEAGKFPAALSGGQQQRVAIARALANDPPVILADEPTGNLDSITADAVFALLHQRAAAGRTVVMVTHDIELATRASRVVHLVDGHMGDGLPPEVAARPEAALAAGAGRASAEPTGLAGGTAPADGMAPADRAGG